MEANSHEVAQSRSTPDKDPQDQEIDVNVSCTDFNLYPMHYSISSSDQDADSSMSASFNDDSDVVFPKIDQFGSDTEVTLARKLKTLATNKITYWLECSPKLKRTLTKAIREMLTHPNHSMSYQQSNEEERDEVAKCYRYRMQHDIAATFERVLFEDNFYAISIPKMLVNVVKNSSFQKDLDYKYKLSVDYGQYSRILLVMRPLSPIVKEQLKEHFYSDLANDGTIQEIPLSISLKQQSPESLAKDSITKIIAFELLTLIVQLKEKVPFKPMIQFRQMNLQEDKHKESAVLLLLVDVPTYYYEMTVVKLDQLMKQVFGEELEMKLYYEIYVVKARGDCSPQTIPTGYYDEQPAKYMDFELLSKQ